MSRSSPQKIYITARPVVTILTSLWLTTENTGNGEVDRQDVQTEFYSNKEQPLRKVFPERYISS